MTDPNLSNLLKWSIRNSAQSPDDATSQSEAKAENDPSRGLTAEALAAIMGGPSDADRMRDSMAAIQSPEVDLENKLIAFENFEMLVEQIDNANNLASLGLWMPLVDQLSEQEKDLRRMAAACVGTAVQNNVQCQERCLAVGAIPAIVKLATTEQDAAVRKKAIRAVSSEIRNYQPAFDLVAKELPAELKPAGTIDATDMDAVDMFVNRIRLASLR